MAYKPLIFLFSHRKKRTGFGVSAISIVYQLIMSNFDFER